MKLDRHPLGMILVVLSGLLMAGQAWGAESGKVKIALHSMQLRSGLELSPDQLEGLSAYLGAKLGEIQGFSVLNTSLVKTHYAKHAEEGDPTCVERNCQMRTELVLGADYGLVVKILAIGKKCVLTGSLYPRAGSATLRTASAQGGCELEPLSGSLDQLVASLFESGDLGPLAAPVVAKPRVEPEPRAEPKPRAEPEPLAELGPESRAKPEPAAPPAPRRVRQKDGWPNFDLTLSLVYAPAPLVHYTQVSFTSENEFQAKLYDQLGLRSAFEWRWFGKMLIGGQVRLLANERAVLFETGPRLGGLFPLTPKIALHLISSVGLSFWSMRENNFFCEDVQGYGGVYAELAFGMRYKLNSWLALEADLSAMAGTYGHSGNTNDVEAYTCNHPEELTMWRIQLSTGLVFGL